MNKYATRSKSTLQECQYYKWLLNLSPIWNELDIGNSISSEQFEWEFPFSIGKCKIFLQFYPKGQYNRFGFESWETVLYLRLVSCEYPDEFCKLSLHIDVHNNYKFIGNIRENTGEFHYKKKTDRWIGIKMISKSAFLPDDLIRINLYACDNADPYWEKYRYLSNSSPRNDYCLTKSTKDNRRLDEQNPSNEKHSDLIKSIPEELCKNESIEIGNVPNEPENELRLNEPSTDENCVQTLEKKLTMLQKILQFMRLFFETLSIL